MELRNATAVAKEASERLGKTISSAIRYIERADWYKGLPGPTRRKKATKPPSKVRVARPKAPVDRIEQYLRRHDAATPNEIASALGLTESSVNEILHHQPDQFRYLPGDRWEVF